MPTSKKTFPVILHVDTVPKLLQLYDGKIGEDKDIKNPDQAVNDMINKVFMFVDLLHTKRYDDKTVLGLIKDAWNVKTQI